MYVEGIFYDRSRIYVHMVIFKTRMHYRYYIHMYATVCIISHYFSYIIRIYHKKDTVPQFERQSRQHIWEAGYRYCRNNQQQTWWSARYLVPVPVYALVLF